MNRRNLGAHLKLGDKYIVLLNHELGKGGFSIVYVGYCTKTRTNVAVKVIDLKEMKKNSKIYDCIQIEVAILKEVGVSENENIIRLYDVYERDQKLYLVLELCQMDLHAYFIRKRHNHLSIRTTPKPPFFSETEIRYWVRQIRSAMSELTKHEYVHRDMKPENFLLKRKDYDSNSPSITSQRRNPLHYENFTLKICDLGFSRKLSQVDLSQTTCGTVPYMSPEMLAHKPYSYKIDIWSIGLIVLEMIRGKRTFESPTRRRRRRMKRRGRMQNNHNNNNNNTKQNNKVMDGRERLKDMKQQQSDFDVHEILSRYMLSEECKSLVLGLLEPDDQKRLSFKEFAEHPFMKCTSENTIFSLDDDEDECNLSDDDDDDDDEEKDEKESTLMSQFSPEQEIRTNPKHIEVLSLSKRHLAQQKQKQQHHHHHQQNEEEEEEEEERQQQQQQQRSPQRKKKKYSWASVDNRPRHQVDGMKLLGDSLVNNGDRSKNGNNEVYKNHEFLDTDEFGVFNVNDENIETLQHQSTTSTEYESNSMSPISVPIVPQIYNHHHHHQIEKEEGEEIKRSLSPQEREMLMKSIRVSETFESLQRGIVIFEHEDRVYLTEKLKDLRIDLHHQGEYTLTITNTDQSFLGVINKFYVQVSSSISSNTPMIVKSSSENIHDMGSIQQKSREDDFIEIRMVTKPSVVKEDSFALVDEKKLIYKIQMHKDLTCTLFLKFRPRHSFMGKIVMKKSYTKFLCVLRQTK